MFYGEHQHSLDVKGRLILPVKFRDAFGEGGYVTKLADGCLAVFTPDEFDRRTQEMLALSRQGAAQRQAMRVWAAGAEEVKPDKQGRIAIPQPLRTYAGLQSDVVVTGAINHVELWDPARWRQISEVGTDGLTSGAQDYPEMAF